MKPTASRSVAGFALTAVLVAGGCSGVASGSTDGDKIFAAACASCHGERGAPPPQMRQQLGVRDLTEAAFVQRRTRAGVVAQIQNGATNGRMPSFRGALSDAQIQAVADYVMTLGPRP